MTTTQTFEAIRKTYPNKSTAEVARIVARLAEIEASLAHGRSHGL